MPVNSPKLPRKSFEYLTDSSRRLSGSTWRILREYLETLRREHENSQRIFGGFLEKLGEFQRLQIDRGGVFPLIKF